VLFILNILKIILMKTITSPSAQRTHRFVFHLLSFTFFLFTVLVSASSFATTCTASANGDWKDASTWSCGSVPACGDTVVINSGVTVTVDKEQADYGSCGVSMVIEVYGTLQFKNGFKLRLDCGSVVNLYTGGIITSTGGGGSNNLIEICNNVVWKTSCGTLNGPLSMPAFDCDGLPVTLVSFTAKTSNHNCVLHWTTATELNNDYFSIEKSTDGKNFTEAGRMNGAGNSTSFKYYTFTDANPLSTRISYYRLRQVDYNGADAVSKTLPVSFSGNDLEIVNTISDFENSSIRVFVNDEFIEKLEYRITDMLGKTVASGSQNSVEGVNEIKVDASKLSRGIYSVSIGNENNLLSKKIFY
jgi:hypothetical protein